MIVIENEKLKVVINKLGAEIISVEKNGYNYIRENNQEFWNRYSPVLFPIVGKLYNDEFCFKGEKFSMTQHGFARDMYFEVVKREKDNVCLKICNTKETLEKYPFEFEFYISYSLDDVELSIEYKVINKSEGSMYYSVGAHPGFRIEKTSQYCISSYSGGVEYDFRDSFITSSKSIDAFQKVFNYELFENDAIIVELDDNIIKIDKDNYPYLEFKMNNLPLVGIWAPYNKDVDFVCIEPWSGIADFKDVSDREIANKKFINKLNKNEENNHSYTIGFIEGEK